MKRSALLFCYPFWFLTAHFLQAHTTPIEAGALSTNQNAQLYFLNGGGFATNSLHFRELLYQPEGRYAERFMDEFNVVVVPATSENGGPAFRHAAPGSFLELMVQSVSGPVGATLGVWEENQEGTETSLRFEVSTGTTNGRNRIALSQSDRSPGSDPFGNIQSYRVTVSQPGLYVVGFVLVDTSSNGTGDGPIHQPSKPLYMYYQAGMTINSVSTSANVVALTVPTQLFRNHFVEATDNLADPNSWSDVLGPVLEDEPHLRTYYITNTSPDLKFYRIRVEDP